MSIEIYVLSDEQLTSTADWQKAIDAEGFPLILSAARPFAAIRHFLPIKIGRVETGFECDHWDPRDILEGYPDVRFDRPWRYSLAFRWGADLDSCLAAYMAAAAYSKATHGVVFDSEQGKILTPKEAVETARNIELQLPSIAQAIRIAQDKINPRA